MHANTANSATGGREQVPSLDQGPDPAADPGHDTARSSPGPGQPGPHGRAWPTRLVRLGAALFVGSLAVLHVVQSELDPRWRYPSEYALGEQGWLMTTAFVGLGVAFLAAASVVGRLAGGQRRTRRAAQALLVVAGVGPLVAAAFETDPITGPPDAATTTGALHQVGAGLSAAIPFAVLLVWLVARREPLWRSVRVPVTVSSLVSLASSLAAAAVVAGYADTRHGPDRIDGLALRVELVCTSAWLLTLAWAVLRLGAAPRDPATGDASLGAAAR